MKKPLRVPQDSVGLVVAGGGAARAYASFGSNDGSGEMQEIQLEVPLQ